MTWLAAGKYLAENPDDIPRLIREFRKRWHEERGERAQLPYRPKGAKRVYEFAPAGTEHGRGRVVDAYVHGDLIPHLHLKIFGFAGRRSVCVQFRNVVEHGDMSTSQGEVGQQIQVPVLVPVTELAQDDERVHLHRQDGVCVGLQRAEYCLHPDGHTAYRSTKTGRLLRVHEGVVSENRKHGATGRRTSGGFDQSPGGVVKGRPEVMQDLAGANAEFGWYDATLNRLPRIFDLLGVYVLHESVRTVRRRVQERSDFVAEVQDVLLGPLYFLPTTRQGHRIPPAALHRVQGDRGAAVPAAVSHSSTPVRAARHGRPGQAGTGGAGSGQGAAEGARERGGGVNALTAFALLLHSALLVWQAWYLRKLTDTTIEHEGNLGYLVEELGDLVEGLRHDRADDAPPDTRVRTEHDGE